MLSWIAAPGGVSVHVDLMSEQVPDATTSAKMRHSLKAKGVRQGLCFTPELRSLKRQGSRYGAALLWTPPSPGLLSSTKNKDHARNP